MSLPSVLEISREQNLNVDNASDDQLETVLVEAMRRDLPLAVAVLENNSAWADEHGSSDWMEDPNSAVGKQLTRIHASDALRPLAAKHFCAGQELSFLNCCNGTVGGKKKSLAELMRLQVQMQNGTLATPDC
jgi:hypothetical protein